MPRRCAASGGARKRLGTDQRRPKHACLECLSRWLRGLATPETDIQLRSRSEPPQPFDISEGFDQPRACLLLVRRIIPTAFAPIQPPRLEVGQSRTSVKSLQATCPATGAHFCNVALPVKLDFQWIIVATIGCCPGAVSELPWFGREAPGEARRKMSASDAMGLAVSLSRLLNGLCPRHHGDPS